MKATKQRILPAVLAAVISFGLAPCRAAYAENTPSTENIYKIIDLSSMYSAGNIYNSEKTYNGGNAGYAGAWYYNDFISDKYINWEEPWKDGMTENILTTSGVKFKLRVVDGNGAHCVVRNRNDSKVYTNFDVEDGAYTSLEILVNTDRPTNTAKKLGVKLNYSDGTQKVSEYGLALFTNGFGEQDKGVKATRCRTSGDLPAAYLGHFTISTDPTKELTSFDIINDRFDFVIEHGEYVIENGEYKTEKCQLSSKDNDRGNYTHVNQIYAVTMVTNEAVIEAAKQAKIQKNVTEIDAAIEALGNIESLKYQQKDDVDAITKKIEKAKNEGISDIEQRLSNYSDYTAAKAKMEELYREIVYKEIADMIDALGNIEDLQYSQKADVEEIGKKIEAAKAEGYEINKNTVENLINYENAVKRIEELYTEQVLENISKKIAALGNVESLTYADKAKVEEIAKMISLAEEKDIAVNSKTLSNYSDYERAVAVVKNQEPTSIPVDISSLYNVNNIYGPHASSVTGNAGYAGRIIHSSMLNDVEWKYIWDDDTTDNIATVEGNRYKIRVLDYTQNSANCAFRNNTQTDKYTNIDVEDAKYMSVNILANSERPATNDNSATLGVKLNYSDGTCEVFEKALAYFCNGYGNDANGGIKVCRMNGQMDNDTYGYIGNFEFKADYSKVLTSIDILNDCYVFETDGDGNYLFDEDGQPKTNIGATGRDKAPHRAMIYALSVTVPYATYIDNIKAEAEEIEKELELRYDISSGVLSDTAAEKFYQLREYIDEIGDDYAKSFSNFNILNSAVPHPEKAGLEENNDVLAFNVKFNTDMTDMAEFITVKQGDKIIDGVVKTNGKTATILVNNTYNYDEPYTVTISKKAYAEGKEAFKTGKTSEFPFEPIQRFSVTTPKAEEKNGNITVSVKAENKSAKPLKLFAIAAAYDETGEIVSVKVINETIAARKSANISETLSSNGKNGLTVKILWMNSASDMNTEYATTVIKP